MQAQASRNELLGWDGGSNLNTSASLSHLAAGWANSCWWNELPLSPPLSLLSAPSHVTFSPVERWTN